MPDNLSNLSIVGLGETIKTVEPLLFNLLYLPKSTPTPVLSKFNKELLADGTGIGRSTLLAPERIFAREAQIENLAAEILSILQIS